MNESRPLLAYADNQRIAVDNRIRVQGRSNMTLLPDFFLVDIYNLSGEDEVYIRKAKKVWVCDENGMTLCSGSIEGFYRHEDGSNDVLSVSVSDGVDFWNGRVNVTVGSGAYVRDAIKTILSGAEFGLFHCDDFRMMRGQTFSGRIADIIHIMAITVGARAYITGGVLNVVGKETVPNVKKIYDDDIIIDPQIIEHGMILKTKVRGYSVGNVVEYNRVMYRIIVQTVNVDNLMGEWSTEMTLIENEEFLRGGMEGGW